MSRRKLLIPCALLVVSLLVCYLPYKLYQDVSSIRGINRSLRVDLQRYQQLRSRLLQSNDEAISESIVQSVDVMKVSLIEKMLSTSWPQGITGVSYEFLKLPHKLMRESDYPIDTVRVVVSFTAQHSVLLAGYLESLSLSVHPQAMEVRGCESYKQAQGGLKNHCALDLHYWSEHGLL